ncbi:MAG: hypothetical protein ABI776_03690, partial [Nocardioidaceae bacterium]
MSDDDQFVIRGAVTTTAGQPLRNGLVRAFDQDLPSRRAAEVLLGEDSTDAEGRFEISYGRDQFSRAERLSADLVLRVFVGNTEQRVRRLVIDNVEVERGGTFFNAPEQCEAEIEVDAADERDSSEYERVRAEIDPVLDGVPLETITAEDLVFLAGETGLERAWLDAVARAARAALERDVAIEATYGLARSDLRLDRPELAASGEAALVEALTAAVARRIIPDSFAARITHTVHRIVAGTAPARSFTVRLVEQGTGEPLASVTVGLRDTTDEGSPRDLGAALTGPDGRLTVSDPGLRDDQPLRIELSVHGAADDDPVVVSVVVGPDETPDVPVRASGSTISAPEAELPAPLLEFLESSGLGTWPALRRVSDITTLPGFPADVADDAVARITAHAELSRLSAAAPVRTALIEGGFTTMASVAAIPAAHFVAGVGDGLGDVTAASLHASATAQMRVLDAVATGELVSPGTLMSADGDPDGDPAEAGSVSTRLCGCEDCVSALGPLAYLADLLRYAVDHLRVAGAPVTVANLQASTRQRFGELPVSCAAAEEQVHQPRLVIESLRSLLVDSPADAARQATLATAEADYLLDTYQRLLTRLGTSYEEVRRLRNDPQGRAAAATRLGITLTTPAPPGGDEVERLLLDPAPSAPPDQALTEAALEVLFGLGDTSRHPLSGGATRNDAAGQLKRWSLAEIVWSRNTDADGSVYLALTTDPGGGALVEVFAGPGRTRRVASATTASPGAVAALVPDGSGGLRGTVEIVFTADTTVGEELELVVVPRFLSWRAAHLRRTWLEEDAAAVRYAAPILDPDLIAVTRLLQPLQGDASTLHGQRSAALAAREVRVHA